LSCAWSLRKLGIASLVLESGSRPGGVIRSERIDGYLAEAGPNSFLPTPETFDILDDAGLTSQMVTADPRAPRYICVDQSLRKVPFGPLSATGLLRMMREPFVRRRDNPDETVKDFFLRRVGQEAHDRLVAPFVTGIYAGDTGQLSMAATFPRLAEMERNHGSIVIGMLRSRKKSSARRGHLSSFPQGMETLPQRMAKDLNIQFNVSDARVGREASAVVLTVPAYRAVEILEPQEPAISHLLGQVEYAPMVVAITSLPNDVLRRPLRGFGFLVPRSERLHLLGTIFSSTLFPNRAPQGRTLLTSYIGGAFEPEAMDWPEGRVWEVVCAELKKVLQTPVQPDPVAMFRHRRAIPQYKVGHGRWVEALRGELKKSPGLFVAGNFIDGVSVPACMESGRRTAQAVAEFLKR
jgi:protoporphyrinogen/coproporphyrinogen III oxidase